MIKLHFFGGTSMVSGSCYLLETGGKKILIDCGMYQGNPELENRNYQKFAFDPAAIDFVIVTHSHLDHIGRIPLLIKRGFEGKIYATAPTIDFAHVMLEDTQKVLLEKARKAEAIPIFAEEEIDHVMTYFTPVKYHEEIKLSEEIFFEFFEAGHILGSAFIKLKVKSEESKTERVIVFSGDLGNSPVPILRAVEIAKEADYVLIESTYGDRLHEKSDKAKEIIENVVEETAAKKGVLMIPSFAMERAQQLLYDLNELVEHKRIPALPIFFDSPLAINITKIYEKYESYFNDEAVKMIKSGDDIFKFPGLKFTPSVKESKQINDVPPPKIIIAGSGMSQGGRIVHHEARYLPDERNTILIVSYQAEGTLGRQIFEEVKEVEIHDQIIPIRARVEAIGGYSAHADQQGLLNWLGAIRKPIKQIFVVHGEKEPAQALAQKIKDEMAIEAKVPQMGDIVDLE